MVNEQSPLVTPKSSRLQTLAGHNDNDDGSSNKNIRMGTNELDVMLSIFKGNVGPGGF